MSTVKSSNGERVMERIQELEQYVREQWAERTRIKRDFLMEKGDRAFAGGQQRAGVP